MDNVPRAVGRIVVWVEDRADTATVNSGSDAARTPDRLTQDGQRIVGVIRVVQADILLAEAGERLDRVGDQHVGATRISVAITAARPGVLSDPLVSSPIARQVSQPQ